MQLRAEQLQQHLTQPLAGLYVLHGDELLTIEAADAIRDPRPLHTGETRRRSVRTVARDLDHALLHLERQLSFIRVAR